MLVKLYFIFGPFFTIVTYVIFATSIMLSMGLLFLMSKRMYETQDCLAFTGKSSSPIATFTLLGLVMFFPVFAYLFVLAHKKWRPTFYRMYYPEHCPQSISGDEKQ